MGDRAGLEAGAGLPSLLYNHVNRSFRGCWGLFDLAGLAGSAFFLLSFAGPPRFLTLSSKVRVLSFKVVNFPQ